MVSIFVSSGKAKPGNIVTVTSVPLQPGEVGNAVDNALRLGYR